jgi:UDP-N-acetylglucosamine--N-acetylmuramyl-(pentapeptide) pyrophosphoryl-undecaprenol N-acetylglucosamine transferase
VTGAMGEGARILIAGGGTGGHVYPGLAIADALHALADVEVIFAGTARGLEARVIPDRGYRLELFDVAPIQGGGPRRAIRGAFVAGRATCRSFGVLRRLAPRAVVSIGGYAAGPVSLAAVGMRVPLAVVEPNSVVGMANRILAPFARRGYVAWEETARRVGVHKTRIFGVPLRAGFAPSTYEATSVMRVVVLGGSQGAAALNERVPEALALVAKTIPGVEVVHQAGSGRAESVASAYERAGLPRAKVVAFVDDVPGLIASADLVIARSGASSVAEIAAVGRASILVPFPHAADDHQTRNAQALERTGGAVCLAQAAADAPRLAREVLRIFSDPALRVRMAAAARRAGKPEAAERIARDLLGLLEIPLIPRAAASSSKLNGHAPRAEVR